MMMITRRKKRKKLMGGVFSARLLIREAALLIWEPNIPAERSSTWKKIQTLQDYLQLCTLERMHQVSSLTDHCPLRLEAKCALNFEANAKYRFLVVFVQWRSEEDGSSWRKFPQLVVEEKKGEKSDWEKAVQKSYGKVRTHKNLWMKEKRRIFSIFLRSLSPRRELIKFLRNILGISSIIIIYWSIVDYELHASETKTRLGCGEDGREGKEEGPEV